MALPSCWISVQARASRSKKEKCKQGLVLNRAWSKSRRCIQLTRASDHHAQDATSSKRNVPCQIRTGDLRISAAVSSHNWNYETDVITDYTKETGYLMNIPPYVKYLTRIEIPSELSSSLSSFRTLHPFQVAHSDCNMDPPPCTHKLSPRSFFFPRWPTFYYLYQGG